MSEQKLPDFVVYYARRLDFDGTKIARLFAHPPASLSELKPGMNIWEEAEWDGGAVWGFRRRVVRRVENEPNRIGVFVQDGGELWFEKDKPQFRIRLCSDEAKLLELVAGSSNGGHPDPLSSLIPLAARHCRHR